MKILLSPAPAKNPGWSRPSMRMVFHTSRSVLVPLVINCATACFVVSTLLATLSCAASVPSNPATPLDPVDPSAPVECTLRFVESLPVRDSADVDANDAIFARKGSRTILPAIPSTVASYSVSGIGPNGASLEIESREPWLRANLVPGRWDLSVQGLNANAFAVMSGSSTLLVEAGGVVNMDVSLFPREGSGAVLLAFDMPSEVPAGAHIQVDIEAAGELPGSILDSRLVEAPFIPQTWDPIASGYHVFRLSLVQSDGSSVGCVQVVRVLSETETAFTVDFASIPGVATIAPRVYSTEPLEPVLPVWARRSSSQPFPLELRGLTGDDRLSWSLDGRALDAASLGAADATNASSFIYLAGLIPGRRRLDLRAFSVDGRRAGSTGFYFDVFSGDPPLFSNQSGSPWAWTGAVSAPASTLAGLPPGHGFIDLASSPSGALIAAVDAPPPGSAATGSAARSTVHFFTVTENGSQFPAGNSPIDTGGTVRSVDRIVLSPDASAVAVWNVDSSWVAFLPGLTTGQGGSVLGPQSTWLYVDTASLGLAATLRIKDVQFSADSRTAWLLSGSAPCRIIEIDTRSVASPATSCLVLSDPLVATSSFSALAVAPDGTLLALAYSSDIAAIVAKPDPLQSPVDPLTGFVIPVSASLKAFFKRTAGNPPWLDCPITAKALGDSSFLVLCSDSGVVGKLGINHVGEAFAAAVSDSYAIPFLSGSASLSIESDGTSFAVSGNRNPASVLPRYLSILNLNPSCGFSSFLESPNLPGLAYSGATAWTGPNKLLVADLASRLVSVYER